MTASLLRAGTWLWLYLGGMRRREETLRTLKSPNTTNNCHSIIENDDAWRALQLWLAAISAIEMAASE
jgi:hypothetical protein